VFGPLHQEEKEEERKVKPKMFDASSEEQILSLRVKGVEQK